MNENLSFDRIGKISENKFGSLMEIIEYSAANDVWVKFLKHGNLVHTNWHCFKNGNVRNPYDKTIYNLGYIGEGKYSPKVNGVDSPQYIVWYAMFKRCYNEKYLSMHPSYIDCSISEKWHNFQNFAKWYDESYYEIPNQRMELDKDILVKGNRIYSPETCVFVPQKINTLFTKSNLRRGDLPIGVSYHKASKRYRTQCKNIDNKRVYLGYYGTPNDAFLAYKNYKEKYIRELADKYKEKIPNKLYNAMINYEVEIID